VPDYLRSKYKILFQNSTMNASEIRKYIISANGCMGKVFTIWDESRFSKFELSSVGIAIAHANYRRRTGQTLDLSMWIN
jgi:hypothetical protein